MNHLTSDEMIDAVEETIEPTRREHLHTCTACAREVAELGAVLQEARAVDMPEPSPLFWVHFSQRVRTALATEPLPGGGWRDLIKWPVMVPVAAMAMILLAVLVTRPTDVRPGPPAVDQSIADVDLSEDGWMVVADLVGTIDLETADAAGLTIAPGTAELAALELNAQEQQELRRLLRAELERAKS